MLSYFSLLLLASETDAPVVPLPIVLALTVLAAPLTEEFIFRGLLLAGLRASVRLLWAAPASAAIFALIHPTMAIVPVFVLGCITALLFNRTGWLLVEARWRTACATPWWCWRWQVNVTIQPRGFPLESTGDLHGRNHHDRFA